MRHRDEGSAKRMPPLKRLLILGLVAGAAACSSVPPRPVPAPEPATLARIVLQRRFVLRKRFALQKRFAQNVLQFQYLRHVRLNIQLRRHIVQ